MKKHMREHQAVYGGELSSHHYFGDFFFCDSGMFAWLNMLQLVTGEKASVAELVEEARSKICITPEINLKLENVDRAFLAVQKSFQRRCTHYDEFDGPSYEFGDQWRFSLRCSKTEPLVRLNFESSSGSDSLLSSAQEVLAALEPFAAEDSRTWSKLLKVY